MKKNTLITSLTLFSVICLAISSLSFTKSKPKDKEMYVLRPGEMQPGEDVLALSGDTIQPPSANAGFALKNSSLYSYIGGILTTIDSLQNKMDTAYLRNLYDSATKRAHGTNYVTVLQIKYGYHTNKVVLYFKPLCLTRDSYNSTTKVGTYSNHNNFDSAYYTCSPTGVTIAPYKNQFLVDSASYVSSMQIRHHIGSSVRAFYPYNTVDSADVNSIIFSFQEVYALVKANNNSRYVKFSNIARTSLIDGSNFVRHSIAIGPSDLPPSKTAGVQGSGVYFNVYADLGSMCPPGCTSLTYQLQ
jgi:hypothetical protein